MSGVFLLVMPFLPLQVLADWIEVKPQEALDVVLALLLLLLSVASGVVHMVVVETPVLVVAALHRERLVVGGG